MQNIDLQYKKGLQRVPILILSLFICLLVVLRAAREHFVPMETPPLPDLFVTPPPFFFFKYFHNKISLTILRSIIPHVKPHQLQSNAMRSTTRYCYQSDLGCCSQESNTQPYTYTWRISTNTCTAMIWMKYCRYDVKHQTINQILHYNFMGKWP